MSFSVCGIFISLLEWLFFEIVKVLISFSVWVNREVSCKAALLNLLKCLQKVSCIHALLGKALVMFKWKITEHKAGFHLAELSREARRGRGVS